MYLNNEYTDNEKKIWNLERNQLKKPNVIYIFPNIIILLYLIYNYVIELFTLVS